MDDGRRERSGHVVGEPRRDLVDARDLTRLVEVPELREAANLALVVAPRSSKRGESRSRDVGRVDLDERLDEIVAERATRSSVSSPGGSSSAGTNPSRYVIT